MGSISVRGLGKAYRQYPTRWSRLVEWLSPIKKPRHHLKWVLQDLNFEIAPGESVGIMGVNGAGKSTLLKIITGTTHATTGSVGINGRVAALLELGMGFHPDFTGRQNAVMGGQLLGYSVAEINALMPHIEAFAEIGEYMDEPVRKYSSGMQVRLAFAVATASRPDVLIVDEALSVGDVRFQAKCYQRVASFTREGTTLLLVSHSADDVVKHCDRAILIKGGRIEMDGSSRDVTNRYLDELFGKKKTPAAAPTVQPEEAANEAPTAVMGDEHDDVYAQRPGYRPEEYRWGHGGAEILDYRIAAAGQVYPSRIDSGVQTDFHMKVLFHEAYDSVVAGFLIKSIEGLFLYGTNSYLAGGAGQRLSAKAGEVKVFRFSMPLRLNAGDYLVSFGMSSGDPRDELVPLDRRYDSVLLKVGCERPFWGIADLDSSFEVAGQ
ncbi:ABC transporter ATP-binding protein [Pseudomonas sp. RC10]|uniref:ABC transporter ATP-binding protein n=1 Tax=Pseudomonas bambusae TaxID=3139142 RepID=UPI0031398BD8